MDTAVGEAADVTAGDGKHHAADLDVGHLLGLNDRVAHVLLGLGGVDDFALAHAAGAGLADADDVEVALAAEFADDGADL